ncbi:hypothetical protein SAMN02745247_01110 [Butyrivibrio hungatei DSM 14810]|uniref:Uncharacterized protein n=1 Tax=Butyrivibrio hungatei DSM 14810 TaxID=1121132 RepID=A0A1M7S5D4_9FIRM|nr:hypothetical protein [Butyrivibrio hungatei]SHN53899.1 hypothetical protein SAMN02745247_01110 [Butyrivibrio hungatei DSM 14810]
MNQKKRKYGVEAGLGTYVSYKTLVPIEHLEDICKIDNHPYHLYAILAFDEFYFVRDKIQQTKDGIAFSIFSENQNGRKEYQTKPVRLANGLDHTKVQVDMVYPYKTVTFTLIDEEYLNKDANPINKPVTVTAEDIFQFSANQFVDKTEYEVLYIGQAYGSDGNRTAIQRLSSHSTLQKILSEANLNYPTKHIFILLLQISESLNLLFDGRAKEYTEDDKSTDKHLKEVICDLPKEKQVINITEAALINYFKPIYNERLVNNFPNLKSKSYKQYFDLDYNALTVEVDLEFDTSPRVQLYTRTARINSPYDAIQYHLFNDENRLSMYEIFR